VSDSKKVKASKPKETGSQEKPDYQAPHIQLHVCEFTEFTLTIF
jgi:hypothetical protein